MTREYDFKKCGDSYLLYKKRVPNFLFWFILSLAAILAAFVIWGAYVIKPDVVRAQSVITVRDTVVTDDDGEPVLDCEGAEVTVREVTAECYLSSAQRIKLNAGDKVTFTVAGLSQNEYGVLTGEITEISEGLSANGIDFYFKADIKINETELSSVKHTVNLISGLTAEARIVCGETTYLKYFLALF